MDLGAENTPRERNFTLLLRFPHKVNAPWLEDQALKLEGALIEECSEQILGPSVSANFAENGFEVDLTVEAETRGEAYDKLDRALSVIERVAGISLEDDSTDEVHSTFASREPDSHTPAAL
jgi:hypothetical protein